MVIIRGGGTHIWKWRTSASKHLRCKGLSVTNCIKKGGLSVTKCTKLEGLSVKCMHQIKRGLSGPKWPKISISSKMSKFSKIGGHWVKVGKNGSLSVKASEKVGSFWRHMARNPKLSAPPGVITHSPLLEEKGYFFPSNQLITWDAKRWKVPTENFKGGGNFQIFKKFPNLTYFNDFMRL